MIEIIIVSHGNYAGAMLESAQLIIGEQEHVCTFGLNLGDSVEQLREKISEAVERASKNGDVLVLTDMRSGSPFNVAASLMNHYSFRHLTGINLPILLEILIDRNYSNIEELCEEVLKNGKETILDVNKLFEESEI